MTFVVNIFLTLFFYIDKVVYWFIEAVYNIIMKIANIALISQASMQAFAERIYILIGIVMLFKVAFSLIQLFANPDKISDAKNGSGNLIKRIIISLVMLVMAPTIFQLAFRVQGIVLDSRILEKLIFNSNTAADKETVENINCDDERYRTERVCGGRTIAFAIFQGFVAPDEEEIASGDHDEVVEYYNEAIKKQSFQDLYGPITAGSVTSRPFRYTFIISTIAGGFAAWVLFMFCFDIAIRAAKLSFLQLLAPIPILSYVDTSKGTNIFKNWVGQCLSTYLEVFVKLTALYFVIYIIGEMTRGGGLFAIFEYTTTGATKTVDDLGLLATAFITLGLLMFANQAPKMLSDIFGIKSSGEFTMNPMKKLGQSPLASTVVGAGLGGLGGLAANAYNKAVLNKKIKGDQEKLKGEKDPEKRKDLEKKIKSNQSNYAHSGIFKGGVSGLARGGLAGFTGGKNGLWKTATTSIDKMSNSRNLSAKGFGMPQRAKNKIDNIAGVKNDTGTTDATKDRIKKLQQAAHDARQLEQNMGRQQANYTSTQTDVSPAEFTYAFNPNVNDETGEITPKFNDYKEYAEDWDQRAASDPDFAFHGTKLSEKQYFEYDQLEKQRVRADKDGKAYEKEVKDLQEDLDALKGKQ